jgi:hypothetical protein
MARNNLLVCSVFAGGVRDAAWLYLQLQQLKKTSGQFDHAVYLGRDGDSSLFQESHIIGRAPASLCRNSEHLEGLRCLSEFCRARPYSAYLVLDSDAFPIDPNWMAILDGVLARFKKTYAAAVRVENLDFLPHPCITYTRDPSTLNFSPKAGYNLLRLPISDISCTAPDCFPLLRTNRQIVHPVLASIYYDLFYHHGCGSRAVQMRSLDSGYYDSVLTITDWPEERIFGVLHATPTAFLRSLCPHATKSSA